MPSEPQPKPKHKYRLQFVPSAWAEWQALDGSVKETLRKLLKKRLDNLGKGASGAAVQYLEVLLGM